jgi:hypothetical protein
MYDIHCVLLEWYLILRYANQVAILLTAGYSYSGVKGDIKVWNPRVESDNEYSTSQVSLKSGPYYDFESVEAGWAVSKTLLISTVFDLHNSKLHNCILFVVSVQCSVFLAQNLIFQNTSQLCR